MAGRPTSGRPARLRAAALLRRGWLVVVCALVVGLGADAIADRVERRYEATAQLVVVPAEQRDNLIFPGSANDANTLALTYAGVLPRDERLLRVVAGRVRLPLDRVRNRVSAVHQGGTSLLTVRFVDPRPARAVRAVNVLVAAATAGRSPAIAPGSLRFVDIPEEATEVSGPADDALVLGLVLGAFLGLLLAIAWERADRRLDDADDVAAELGVPVGVLRRLPPATLAATLERWAGLAPDERRVSVALVPVSDRLAGRAREAAETLAQAARDHGWSATVDGADRPAGGERRRTAEPAFAFLVGGRPGGESAGEAAALRADVTVLVLRRGLRARRVRRAVELLAQFGVEPVWALLVRGPALRELRPGGPPPAGGAGARAGAVPAGDRVAS